MREGNVGIVFQSIWSFGGGMHSKSHFVDVAFVVSGDSLEVIGRVSAFPDGPVHFHLQRGSSIAGQFRSGEGLPSKHMRYVKALAVHHVPSGRHIF